MDDRGIWVRFTAGTRDF